ncbi:hypothetical protein RFI_33399, partial [Reticulomyxa filosa]
MSLTKRSGIKPLVSQSHGIDTKEVIATESELSDNVRTETTVPTTFQQSEIEKPGSNSPSPFPPQSNVTKHQNQLSYSSSEEDLDQDSQWYYPPGHESSFHKNKTSEELRMELTDVLAKKIRRQNLIESIHQLTHGNDASLQSSEDKEKALNKSKTSSVSVKKQVSTRKFIHELEKITSNEELDPTKKNEPIKIHNPNLSIMGAPDTNALDDFLIERVFEEATAVPDASNNKLSTTGGRLNMSTSNDQQMSPLSGPIVIERKEEDDGQLLDDEIEDLEERKEKIIKLRKGHYKVERRLSSEVCKFVIRILIFFFFWDDLKKKKKKEYWKSRYKTDKMNRLRIRHRGKSNPELLPKTQRWYRKCEYEYRPNTNNLFMLSNALHLYVSKTDDDHKVGNETDILKADDTLTEAERQKGDRSNFKLKVVPSHHQEEEFLFRYLFDDDDYADSEPSLSLS